MAGLQDQDLPYAKQIALAAQQQGLAPGLTEDQIYAQAGAAGLPGAAPFGGYTPQPLQSSLASDIGKKLDTAAGVGGRDREEHDHAVEEMRKRELLNNAASLGLPGAQPLPPGEKPYAGSPPGTAKQGTPNPFAARGASGAGGPGAPPFDPTGAGYRALGDNPNDPRQAAAAQNLAQESAGLAGVQNATTEEAAKAGEALAAFHAGEQGRIRQQQLEDQVALEHHQAYVQDSKQKYEQASADLASQRVDPDEIFRGASGGARRIIASIGAAMGAVGAVYGHTENFAQKIIDEQINRSMEAQKENIATKRAGVEFARSGYQMAREQGMDDAEARAVHRALGNQAAAQTAEELAQKAQNTQQKNAALLVAQTARQNQAAAELEHTKAANAKGFELGEQRRKEAIAAARAGAAATKKGDAAEAKVEQAEAPATAASQALHEHIRETGGVEGYGLLGRAGRAVSPKFLTTEQTRANMRNLDRLAAVEAKDEQGRVNPEVKADILKHVVDEEDVKRFLTENDYRHQIVREAARRTGATGGGGKGEEEAPE